MKQHNNNIEEEFRRSVEEESDSLFRHALLRVSNREVALDLVQDTYTKTWEYATKGNKITNLRAFFFKVLNNLIIDHYRKKKDYSLESMVDDDVPLEVFDDLQGDDRQQWADMLDGELILEKLEELPDIYKQAIILRYVEGFAPQEIAEMIDESENVVSVRIYRGLRKLKKLCKDYE